MRWAIYYDDGRTYTSEEGSWDEAPTDGVLVVAIKDGDRVDLLSGSDHYIMVDGETIVTTDDLGATLRRLRFIKFGRWSTNSRMQEALRRAAEDTRTWQR